MSLTLRSASLLVLTAACAGAGVRAASSSRSPSSGVQPTRAQGAAPSATPNFQAVVDPFPVIDSAGRLLEAAFLGGFNAPRPQLVDADGDGDLDLFVQEVNSKIGYFERDGERDGLPRFVFRTEKYGNIDAGQWYRFADVDRDGDLDLLTEQPYSYIKYYRNDGARGAQHFSIGADTLRDPAGKPIFADAQNIPQLGDLDCNGRSDLLIGRLDGTVSRYEAAAGANAPAGAAPMFQLVANEFEGIRIVGEGQLGGGDPMQGPPAKPAQGGPSAHDGVADSLRHGANTMALADHDGDGDLDLFWGDYFEPGLLLIPNTGSCAAPNFRNTPVQFPQPEPFATSGYNAPTFGDVNGDKQTDLVFGVLGGAYNALQTSISNLYYIERTASAGWSVRTRQLLPVADVGSESIPTLVDLDGDGDTDLLLANKIDPSALKTSRIYWFENVGAPTKPSLRQRGWIPVQGRERFHFAPAFGDLDGDGRLDVALGEWGTRVGWYRYADGELKAVDTAIVAISRGSNTTPTLGDLDGDGDLDLLVGEASGWINHYRNDGSKTKPSFTLVTEEFEKIKLGRRSTPHLADVDKDGDLDLLLGSEGDGVALYRNTGSRTAPKFERDSAFAVPVSALAAPTTGDIDGDGNLELMVGGSGGGVLYFKQKQ